MVAFEGVAFLSATSRPRRLALVQCQWCLRARYHQSLVATGGLERRAVWVQDAEVQTVSRVTQVFAAKEAELCCASSL